MSITVLQCIQRGARGDAARRARMVARAAAPPKADSVAKTVTIEYQRAQAKDLVAYFKSKAEAEAIQKSQVFGWTPANEINNGRWVMMGFAIGLLTEYATGVDFPDQLALMCSYLGIVDLDV